MTDDITIEQKRLNFEARVRRLNLWTSEAVFELYPIDRHHPDGERYYKLPLIQTMWEMSLL